MDPIDAELRHALKGWATRSPIPTSIRARLLGSAGFPRQELGRPSPFQIVEILNALLTWAMVYSLEGRIVTLRLIS